MVFAVRGSSDITPHDIIVDSSTAIINSSVGVSGAITRGEPFVSIVLTNCLHYLAQEKFCLSSSQVLDTVAN